MGAGSSPPPRWGRRRRRWTAPPRALPASERRQQAWEARRQQRLPGSGRADQQEVVPAGGAHLEGPSAQRLAAHIAQVGCGRRTVDTPAYGGLRPGAPTGQCLDQLGQGGGRSSPSAHDQPGLVGTVGRHHHLRCRQGGHEGDAACGHARIRCRRGRAPPGIRDPPPTEPATGPRRRAIPWRWADRAPPPLCAPRRERGSRSRAAWATEVDSTRTRPGRGLVIPEWRRREAPRR